MHELLGIDHQLSMLVVAGPFIALSSLGSKLFQRVGIPQVVGFTVVGLILGPSLPNPVPEEHDGWASRGSQDGPHRLVPTKVKPKHAN